MRLAVKDQINISSVQSETLRPGAEIDVSDAFGEELLKAHPAKFAKIGRKAEVTPQNKAEAKPANKAAPGATKAKAG